MSDPIRAVFLSYASADAEAARRVCEALRAAGMEVWFDVDGGLETGDEWDAKIRRQIKECVLFLPLISANTQAREEGYFRIEWDLAAERARGIASGVPFILPIVLDDTREPDALVPDRFRSVQWTRAPGGELSSDYRTRFARLWSHRLGLVKHAGAAAAAAAPTAPGDTPAVTAAAPGAPAGRPRRPTRLIAAAVATLALGGGLIAFLNVGRSPTPESNAPAPAAAASALTPPSAATSATASGRNWPKNPELKRAMALLDRLDTIPEDVRLAEELVQRELDKNTTDAESVTAMARVQSMWLLRGWDRSPARFQRTKAIAERALQLAPDEPEALQALAIQLFTRGTEPQRALELAQRAVDLNPDEPRFHRTRNNCLFNLYLPPGNILMDKQEVVATEGLNRARAETVRSVERFPRDPLIRYDLSRAYRDLGRWADFERVNDETLALAPVANALVWKARARFALHGDFEGMKAALDQVPARVRAIERTVYSYFIYAVFTGRTADGLDALNAMTESWMIDFDFRGPKALLTATLHERAGRNELARVQFDLALTELNRMRALDPEDPYLFLTEAWIKRGLGRPDEARAALRIYNEALVRPFLISRAATWWFGAVAANLLLGERETALTLMRESCALRADGRLTLRERFAIDPRMAPFRDDPEIRALLAEPTPTPAAAVVSPASTAASTPASSANPVLSEAAQLAARAKELYSRLAYTRQDLATAEEIARRATQLDPSSADAWGALAAVHGTYLQRGWDLSEQRRTATQEAASKALGLNPEQPDALFGLGYLLNRQGAREQLVDIFRRALAAAPGDNRIARAYAGALSGVGKHEEAQAVLEAALQRDPKDPVTHYNLAMQGSGLIRTALTSAQLESALQHLDAGIAAQPIATLLIAKTMLIVGWRGDLAAARASLAELEKRPLAERTEDRAVFVPLWIATLERNPDRAVAAAALTARPLLDDWNVYRRPKHWHLALVRQASGKQNLARLDWQRAEAALSERLRGSPNDPVLTWELACTLAWLGRDAEADALFAPLEGAWREEPSTQRAMRAAHYAAARSDAVKTAAYLETSINTSVDFSSHVIALDPWFDKVRDHPDVQRVLLAHRLPAATP